MALVVPQNESDDRSVFNLRDDREIVLRYIVVGPAGLAPTDTTARDCLFVDPTRFTE